MNQQSLEIKIGVTRIFTLLYLVFISQQAYMGYICFWGKSSHADISVPTNQADLRLTGGGGSVEWGCNGVRWNAVQYNTVKWSIWQCNAV